jgi:hypothetical protein
MIFPMFHWFQQERTVLESQFSMPVLDECDAFFSSVIDTSPDFVCGCRLFLVGASGINPCQ